MKAAILKKYRLIIKTMGYVGWALFWLLLWDVAVTVDFMLFLTAKINLPLMPLRRHWWRRRCRSARLRWRWRPFR